MCFVILMIENSNEKLIEMSKTNKQNTQPILYIEVS